MSESVSFPQRHIVQGFQAIERRLVEALQYVPYCAKHKQVWSPVFADCIIDACHQLDSLWKVTARQSPCVSTGSLNIVDYHRFFGGPSTASSVHCRWTLFWSDSPLRIAPFQLWDSGQYQTLRWWDAYNNLKHDRWRNIEQATLESTVDAVAGLFLALVRCEYCRDAIADVGWLSARPGNPNPRACLGEDSSSTKDFHVVVETGLFSYPVGWHGETIKPGGTWEGNASYRFKRWFDEGD